MTNITFIHTSDFQLGMKRGFLGSDGQSLFDDSRLKAVTELGALAEREGAAFIVVAGDVFEANALSQRVTGRVLERLKALPVPVYLLPGNHDPLVADSIFSRTEDIEGVHVISSTDPIEAAPGVEIVGAPWLSKFPPGDPVHDTLVSLEPTDSIRIGIGHGQVSSFGNESATSVIDVDFVEEKLADGSVDYLALGDTHSAMPVGSTGRIWYSGSPETTDYHEKRTQNSGGEGEFNSGKALVVRIEKTSATNAEVKVKEHQTGEWTFDAVHRELSSQEDVDAFLAELDAYPDKSRTCVKYALDGTLALEAMQSLNEGLAERAPVFSALYARERINTISLEPTEEELANLSVGGVANAALAELLEDSEDPVARDAVNLLFRLSQEVK